MSPPVQCCSPLSVWQLGGSQTIMIGQTLWTEFFANKDWPVASAVAVVLLCLLVAPMLFYQQMRARDLEGGR